MLQFKGVRIENLKAFSPRLVVRPYTLADHEVWRDSYLGRLSKQNEYDMDLVEPEQLTKRQFQKVLSTHRRARERDRLYVFGAFHRHTGQVIGFLDIYVQVRLSFQHGNLGYVIHNQFWNQGYGKEAAQAALKIAFEGLHLHRVEAGVEPENQASQAVARAIGMRSEGLRRSAVFEDERWKDLTYFSITADEFGLEAVAPKYKTTLRDLL